MNYLYVPAPHYFAAGSSFRVNPGGPVELNPQPLPPRIYFAPARFAAPIVAR